MMKFLLSLSLFSAVYGDVSVGPYAGNKNQPFFQGDGLDKLHTSVGLQTPLGLYFNPTGELHITNMFAYAIRKVGIDDIVSTVAGTNIDGYSGYYSGVATSTNLSPYGLCGDSTGVIYITDKDSSFVRKLSDGILSTFAGNFLPDTETGEGNPQDNGPATSASISPYFCATDTQGDLYFTSRDHYVVRKVEKSSGLISRVAGTGNDADDFSPVSAGDATSVSLRNPTGIFIDSTSTLYLTEGYGSRVLKMDLTSGYIETIAGALSAYSYAGDGGLAIDATFDFEQATLAGDPVTGDLYIAQSECIRKIDGTTSIITTIAGTPGEWGYAGDFGPANEAHFSNIQQIAAHNGKLYVAEFDNNVVRELYTPTAPGPDAGAVTFQASVGFTADKLVDYCMNSVSGNVVAIGVNNDNTGMGVFYSTDYGATFTQSADEQTTAFSKLICSAGSDVVLALTRTPEGETSTVLSYSADSGITWSSGDKFDYGNNRFRDVAVSNDGQTWYILEIRKRYYGRVRVFTDHGATNTTTVFPEHDCRNVTCEMHQVTVDKSDNVYVYAYDNAAVYQSSDAGQSFVSLTALNALGGSFYDVGFSGLNGVASHVTATGEIETLFTADGGANWAVGLGPVTTVSNTYRITTSANLRYVVASESNTRNLFYSTDYGQTFTAEPEVFVGAFAVWMNNAGDRVAVRSALTVYTGPFTAPTPTPTTAPVTRMLRTEGVMAANTAAVSDSFLSLLAEQKVAAASLLIIAFVAALSAALWASVGAKDVIQVNV